LRKLLLLIALAGLAGALVYLLGEDPMAGDGAGGDGRAAGAAAAAEPGPIPPAAASGAAVSGAAGETGRTELAGAPPGSGEPVALEIRSVAMDGSGPVPDCPLVLFDLDQVDQHQRQDLGARGGLSAELLALGQRSTTDARGLLQRRHAGGGLVVIAADAFQGLAIWRPGEGAEIELLVAPRQSLQVQVLDHQGAPAIGVPVVLSAREGQGGSASVRKVSRPPDGVAVFLDFGLFRAALTDQEQAFAAAALAAPEPAWAPFPLEQPPDQPVVLRLPPTGELVVQLRGAGAARRCTLAPLPGEGDRRPFLAFGGVNEPVVDGQALFRHVPLGLRYRATLDLEGYSGSVSGDGAGPAAPGERVELVVDLGAGTTFTGTLLQEDGSPGRAGRWRYQLRAGSGSSFGAPFEVAEGGRFQLRLPAKPAAWALSALEVEAAPRTIRPGVGPELAVARVALAGRYPPGVHELGELRLAPVPVLVAGRADDGAGEPVAGAVLRAEFLELRSDDFGEVWQQVDHERQVTGPNGRFRIQARTPAGELRLRAQKSGSFQEQPVAFAAGEPALEVELLQAGEIVMEVLLPEGFGAQELEAIAQRQNDPSQRWSGQPPFGGGEELLWRDLPPGVYELELSLRGLEQPVELRGGLVVRGGETTRAARADLRQRVFPLHITVLDEAGAGMARMASVMRVSLDGMGARGGFRPVDDRRFSIPALALAPRDYLVQASGYRPVLLRELLGDVEVVMRLIQPTRLRLPDPLPAPDPGLDLRVTLRRRTDGGASVSQGRIVVPLEGELVPGGELTAAFEVSGRYQFFWTYSRQVDGATELLGSLVSEFEVREEDHGGVIALPPAVALD